MRMTASMMHTPKALSLPAVLGALCLLAGLSAEQTAWAQFRPPGRAVKRELYIEVDDSGVELLRRAKRYIDIGDWALAVQLYDKILTDPKFATMLTKDAETGVILGLRSRVRGILLKMPPEGRHAYRLLRKVDAQRTWKLGEQGDITELQKLMNVYPASGYAGKAACRLAEIGLEEGRFDQAVSAARRALTSFSTELTKQERLRALRVWAYGESMQRHPESVEEVVKKISAIDEKQATEVLKTTNQLILSLPERVSGKAPELEDVKWVHSFSEFYSESHFPRPMSEPVTDGERIYFHNSNYAYCLSVRTGKLLWRTSLKPDAADFHIPAKLCRLVMNNSRLVLTVDGEGLVCLESATGNSLWTISQQAVRDAVDTGTPMILSDRIYCENGRVYIPSVTAGDNHEYRVLCFELETGRFLWSTLVCSIRGGSAGGGFTLSINGSRMYALTGDGVLASLGSDDGSLLWVKEYGQGGKRGRTPVVAVSGGRLLVAPPEMNSVFVFDAFTGKQLGRGQNKGGPAILGTFRGAFVRLYRNGELRTGPGGARLIAGLGKKLNVVCRPRIVNKYCYFSLQKGVFAIDLTNGNRTNLRAWMELAGRVVPAGDRLVVVTARGAVAFGGQAQVPAVAWLKDKEKVADPAFLAKRLASDSWAEREAASKALMALGKGSQEALTASAQSPDLEVSIRAADLLYELSRDVRKKRWNKQIRPEWVAAVPDLLNRLTHRNPKVRLDSLERLGEIVDPDIVVLFRELLVDPSPSLKLKAARLLYLRGDRSGFEVFKEIIEKGSSKQRLEIVNTLATRKTKSDRMKDFPLLTLLLNDKDPKVLAPAAVLLTEIGDRKAVPVVKKLIGHKTVEVRVAVIRSLGNLQLDSVGPVLAPLVKDKSEYVRSEAIKALSFIETKVAAEALCIACLDKKVLNARAAMKGLVRLSAALPSNTIPVKTLMKLLDSKDADVRRDAAMMMKERTDRPMEIMVRLALDPSAEVRGNTLTEIYNRAGPQHVKVLEPLASAKDSEVRYAAVQIIGELSSPKAEPVLLKFLEDSDAQVRDKAGLYLGMRSQPRTVLRILRMREKAIDEFQAASKEVKQCQAALAKLKDKKDGDPAKRIAMAAVKRSSHRLKEATSRRDQYVKVIEEMDADVEAPGLIFALQDEERDVRAIAIKELANIAGVDRGFEADASEKSRKPIVEAWARWYFIFKHSADADETRKSLFTSKGKVKIDAAKKVKDLCLLQTADDLLKAFSSETTPWVAVELEKILSDFTGLATILKAEAKAKDLKPAAEAWGKRLGPWRATFLKGYSTLKTPKRRSKAPDKAPNKTPKGVPEKNVGGAKKAAGEKKGANKPGNKQNGQ